MSSLNAGFELDNELPNFGDGSVEEDMLPPTILDLSEDGEAVTALENSIIDLQDLANDIEQAEGMSRDFAMEALRICPNVLSASPNHFTLSPSATRLKVSLEEISTGVWALIAAAAAAIIGVIYKVFKWLSGDKTEGGSGNTGEAAKTAEATLTNNLGNVKEYAEATQGAATTIQDATVVLRAGIEVSDAALSGVKPADAPKAQQRPIKYTSFDNLIGKLLTDDNKYEHAKKFLESGDPVFHDIITHGPYTKICEEGGDALVMLRDAINTKLKLLEEILKDDIHSSTVTAQWKHNQSLDNPVLNTPIKLKFRNHEMSMDEIARQIRIVKEGTENQRPTERINFDTLFQRMASVYKKPTNIKIFTALRDSTIDVAKLEHGIEAMQRKTNNLSQDGNAGSASTGVAVRLRQCMLALGKDLYGYAHLAQELKFHAMHTNYLSKEALGFGTEIVRKITHAMRMDGQRVPPEWEKVVDDLGKQLEHLRDAYRKDRRK